VEEGVVVAETAKMEGVNEWGKERYASKTWENFVLWKRVFGGDDVANGERNSGSTIS
jgi:hypothetical protein